MTAGPTVIKSIEINAPVSLVWKAIVTPGILKRWMSDDVLEIVSTWEVGGPFIVTGKANGHHEYKGFILSFQENQVFSYSSWSKISKLSDEPSNYTEITFILVPQNGGTLVELTHSNLKAEAALEHSNFYWSVALQSLKRVTEELAK